MKIAIVDDLEEEREQLSAMLKEEFLENGVPIDELCFFTSGEELLQQYRLGAFDLIFLDIFMGAMTGVETARKIREEDEEVKLVFCTTSNEFASESYALNVDYYLRKPFTKEDIQGMCKRLHLEHVEAGRYLMLPDGQKLLVKNFIYSEYYNHVITIHTKKGEDMKTRMSQTNLVNLLCSYPGFIACSKGVIVNFNEIEKIEGNIIWMSNQEEVQISRRKVKEVNDAYADFLFTQVRSEM